MIPATHDRDVAAPPPEQAPADPSPSGGRAVRLAGVAAVVVLILVAVLAFTAGRLSAPAPAMPTTDSAAAGFARDMSVHHAQAVDMSMIVRDRTDDADVRILAYDIALTQQQQIGQMYAWLNLWGLPQAGSAAPMAWMADDAGAAGDGMEMGDAIAPPEDLTSGEDATGMGMASREDMARLAELTGRDAEELFLQLMTAHHIGGVEMAQAILDRPAPAQVHALAQAMVNAQNAEITVMTTMLEERDGA